jgi:acyl-CoA synthetase (AMP-forming)/AMP-acid ligase II
LLTTPLIARAQQYLCANLISLYGSTEANIVATAPCAVTPDGAVGYVTPDTAIEIVDADDAKLPAGTEGIIRIGGDYTVAGYVGDAEESRSAFRDGWFYPGDIGMITPEDMLIVTGRTKNVINAGGDKMTPERIEAAIAGCGGLDEAGVVGIVNAGGIEEVWAAVVSRQSIDQEMLAASCRAKLPAGFVPRGFISLPELPKNQAGKLDRQKLSELIKVGARSL